MKHITAENYKEFEPEDLASGLVDGSMLIQGGIELAVEIIKHISEAVGQRKLLKKRVEALEEQSKLQIILNDKFLKLLNK